MPAPVIGEINERGVPNNQWDVYWYNQNHANDVTNVGDTSTEAGARRQASIYYGDPNQLGADSADYRSRIKAKVNEPSALANRLTQSANTDIARANAKAGMAGIDTTAASIREKRNATTKANEIEQSQSAINLANYGKSIGAGISGTESLAAAGAGRKVAETPTPTPSYGGGLSIICTELYRQKKITLKELSSCRDFGDSVSDETFRGYLIIAKPIVKLMKKSDRFSDLFIDWAKNLSKNKPNNFTLFMIPICTVIGKISVEVHNARRA